MSNFFWHLLEGGIIALFVYVCCVLPKEFLINAAGGWWGAYGYWSSGMDLDSNTNIWHFIMQYQAWKFF